MALPTTLGKPVEHTPELVTRVFDKELAKIQQDLPTELDRKAAATLPEARRIAEEKIVQDTTRRFRLTRLTEPLAGQIQVAQETCNKNNGSNGSIELI